jgi:hypothetical protein
MTFQSTLPEIEILPRDDPIIHKTPFKPDSSMIIEESPPDVKRRLF